MSFQRDRIILLQFDESAPLFSIDLPNAGRLSSDGEHLAASMLEEHSVNIYKISALAQGNIAGRIGGAGDFNLPQFALASYGSLFIADTGFNRVHICKSIEDAISGRPSDAILGHGGRGVPAQATRKKFFGPAGMYFDGSYLWVSEFKFSFRLLRFSIR